MNGRFSICNENPICEQTVQEYESKHSKRSKTNLPPFRQICANLKNDPAAPKPTESHLLMKQSDVGVMRNAHLGKSDDGLVTRVELGDGVRGLSISVCLQQSLSLLADLVQC